MKNANDIVNLTSTLKGFTRTYEKNPLANTQCLMGGNIADSDMRKNSRSTQMHSIQSSLGMWENKTNNCNISTES
jgi:hypothetical protein